MIVVCRACQAEFYVIDALLGRHGREVRCSLCSHVWVQKRRHWVDKSVDWLQGVFCSRAFIAMVLLFSVLSGGLYFGDHVVAHIPALRPYYNAIGLDSYDDVILDQVTIARPKTMDADMRVSGYMVNQGSANVAVSPLRLRAYDHAHRLVERIILDEVKPSFVSVGERYYFDYTMPVLPAEAVHVVVDVGNWRDFAVRY